VAVVNALLIVLITYLLPLTIYSIKFFPNFLDLNMLGHFSAIADHIPLQKKIVEPTTDGLVNKLHHRVTFGFLLVASLLVTCLDYIGNGKNVSHFTHRVFSMRNLD